MAGHILRPGDPAGVEQEMWSLLTLYQTLRTVGVDAAESLPGTGPNRCGFSIAVQTARDQVIHAAGPAEGRGPYTDSGVPVSSARRSRARSA